MRRRLTSWVGAWVICMHVLFCECAMQYRYVSADPEYLSCGNSECREEILGKCLVKTCSGSITFRIINIRTTMLFAFFTGGFDAPCLLKTSSALNFSNPSSPLYAHLASPDSTATSVCATSRSSKCSCGMWFCLWSDHPLLAIFFFADSRSALDLT